MHPRGAAEQDRTYGDVVADSGHKQVVGDVRAVYVGTHQQIPDGSKALARGHPNNFTDAIGRKEQVKRMEKPQTSATRRSEPLPFLLHPSIGPDGVSVQIIGQRSQRSGQLAFGPCNWARPP